ncbi:MAG: hypothetical protein KDC61_01440 [Saprospiraceae bacterium]|nr:hypothetical protein [Saprospiraceae bacterium]MCB0573214.1 hypothetical protein [Saprospiraceae bacterium]MCB9304973.1 hypothetical protein [Lewinellaceae bacterium]MCB9353252.1 hypothetical protein [Lewinellaceae bacterium]
MLESIRIALYNKSLRKILAGQKRRRRSHNLESAGTVGILFDASSEKTRREVMEYAHSLEEKGKKVRMFGYFSSKQPPEGHPFGFFDQKETSWTGVPKSEKATAFAQEHLDVLIYLNPEACKPLEWLAAASQASMKIGFATDRPNDFDLLLETPGDKGIGYFVEQLHHYLGNIVLKKNESARAI